MSSDDRAADAAAHEPATPGPDAHPEESAPRRGLSKAKIAIALIAAVFVLDVVALILVPPYPKEHPGEPVQNIADLILANLELPAPRRSCTRRITMPHRASCSATSASRTRSSRCGS